MKVYAFCIEDIDPPDQWLYTTEEVAKAAALKSFVGSYDNREEMEQDFFQLAVDPYEWVQLKSEQYWTLYLKHANGTNVARTAYYVREVEVYEEVNF